MIDIVQFGDEVFGVTQTNQYRDQLKKRFSQIAKQPMLYPSVNHIHIGYRRSVHGVHSIYYRINSDIVEIMRILGRQNPEDI